MAKADYSISPHGRAVCPVCGGEYSLTKKGVLRHHDDKRSRTNLPFHPRCAGAGKAPGHASVAPASAPVAAVAASPIEERRRRLTADISDARTALNRAQQHFDKLCDELGALAREERQAKR